MQQAAFVPLGFIVLLANILKLLSLALLVISVKKEVLYRRNVGQVLTKIKHNEVNVKSVLVDITVTIIMISEISLPIYVLEGITVLMERDLQRNMAVPMEHMGIIHNLLALINVYNVRLGNIVKVNILASSWSHLN